MQIGLSSLTLSRSRISVNTPSYFPESTFNAIVHAGFNKVEYDAISVKVIRNDMRSIHDQGFLSPDQKRENAPEKGRLVTEWSCRAFAVLVWQQDNENIRKINLIRQSGVIPG